MQAITRRMGATSRCASGVILALGVSLGAPTPSAAQDWDTVMRLKAGTTLRVDRERGARLVGAMVRVDTGEVTLLVNGVHEIVTRSGIRRIDRERPLSGAAPWLGMLIGGAWAAMAVAGDEDLTTSGHTMWFGIGAAIGATGGAAVRGTTRFVPVYRSEATPPSAGPVAVREVQAERLGRTRPLNPSRSAMEQMELFNDVRRAPPHGSLRMDVERLSELSYFPPGPSARRAP